MKMLRASAISFDKPFSDHKRNKSSSKSLKRVGSAKPIKSKINYSFNF
jgi:hypothetical protein